VRQNNRSGREFVDCPDIAVYAGHHARPGRIRTPAVVRPSNHDRVKTGHGSFFNQSFTPGMELLTQIRT